MSPESLSIAYGDQSSPRALVVAEILRSQGHEVVTRSERTAFLTSPEPDLYLLGRQLQDGTRGLDLLAELRRAGRRAPVLLLDENGADAFGPEWHPTPFLTTKPNHIGLGLALTQRDVALLGGRLEFLRNPGGETCVRITLPSTENAR